MLYEVITRFCLIECRIGACDGIFSRFMFPQQRTAETACHVSDMLERLRSDQCPDMFADGSEFIDIAYGEQHQELFSAPSDEGVRPSDTVPDSFGKFNQGVVTAVVAEGVVDLFEVININHDDAHHLLLQGDRIKDTTEMDIEIRNNFV